MTLCTVPSVSAPRPQRRPGRPPSGKRLLSRDMPGKVRSAYRRSLDPCDNSNDSGLGFDHHMDPHHHTASLADRLTGCNTERAEAKRPRFDVKLEHDDVNDGYCFPETIRQCKDNISLIRTAPVGAVPSLSITNNSGGTSGRAVPRCIPLPNRQSSAAPVPLTTQLSSTSRYSDVSLMIVKQPEQQHRARYQTEGSRGAVKDREGNGFPIVQLTGYYKPATLQVYIGTDVGKVAPHMFYQACKVSGKNSTPCIEKKMDGTCVIELALDPSKEMSATCDCVGILKERNVDVEHRFPDQLGNRSKKKSTRCRMIFRTTITHENGTQETLQVCSQPIVCTQPPGVPEISKKSLTSCPASGGLELFVLGKNFLKDTKVFFQQFDDGHVRWEQAVVPDKEYLQQAHFVCVVPPYRRPDITEPVSVRLSVVSSGKTSESHQFVYTPVNGAMPSVHMEQPQPTQQPFFWQSSAISKREQDLDMMPPPDTSMVPMATRRPSISMPCSSEVHSPPMHVLKQEYIDDSSQSSMVDSMDIQERYRNISESSLDVNHGDSNMSMINENSMDMMHNNNSMMSHMNENSNISVVNDDSVDIMMRRRAAVRRNSLNRSVSSICENSVDVSMSNSNISMMNEDSSCSAMMHCSNSMVTDRMILTQPSINHNTTTSTAVENVMDLRMKMPMASVTDFVTTASSIATLQRFGIEPTSAPLPTQSAQSVESYLTKIESKPDLLGSIVASGPIKTDVALSSQVIMTGPTCGLLSSTTESLEASPAAITEAEPVFIGTQRNYLSSQSEAINIVAKSEAAAIAEPSSEQTIAASTTVTTMTTALERSIPMPINTERLDALVNSTVESHIGSPPNADTSSNKTVTASNTPEVMISRDVMLGSQSSLLTSPVLRQQQDSPTLTPEVILNPQLSPSLMCHGNSSPLTPQDALLPVELAAKAMSLSPASGQSSPERITSLHSPILASEPEKAVLLEAAVDFLETQKKISEFVATTEITTNGQVMNQLQRDNNFVPAQFTTAPSTLRPSSNLLLSKDQQKPAEFVIPLPVKEMANSQSEVVKKNNEDRMIPQSFTSLTENELINLINPSCFDQV